MLKFKHKQRFPGNTYTFFLEKKIRFIINISNFAVCPLWFQVVYFSYQIYDGQGEPKSSVVDYQLVPSKGKNPFQDPTVTAGEEIGEYVLHLTLSGKTGQTNEMRVDPFELKNMSWSILMLRIYGRDPSTAGQEPSRWGWVDVPKIEFKNADGEWEETERCPVSKLDAITKGLIRFTQVIIRGTKPTRQLKDASCSLQSSMEYLNSTTGGPYTVRHGMTLFAGDHKYSEAKKIPFSNYDSNYLFWCGQTDDNGGPNIIIKLNGVLPTLPGGLYQSPKTSEYQKYDVRYVSFMTTEMVTLKSTYESIAGYDIEAFYGGAEQWKREYSVVMAGTADAAKKCNLYDEKKDVFLDWQHPDLPAPIVKGIVYRQIISIGQRENTTDTSVYSMLQNCNHRPDDKSCDLNTPVEDFVSVMKDKYPSGTVYLCSDDGTPQVLTEWR